MSKQVYLDYNSTTPVDPEVYQAMQPYFLDSFGNASSVNHQFGVQAKAAIDHSRKIIAHAVGCRTKEIIFTGSATESINLAIKGIANSSDNPLKKIITLRSEHKAVLDTLEYMSELGVEVELLDVDEQGYIDLDNLNESIDKNTILVAILHGNNEIGTIQPIKKIGAMCEQFGIPLFVDGAQTFGKISLDVKEMNIALFAGSGHKIYGPKGVGFLYKRDDIHIPPLLHGGGHEQGYRSGTHNIPGIVGLGKAAELALSDISGNSMMLEKLSKLFLDTIDQENIDYSINGPIINRLPGNLNLCFHGVESDWLILHTPSIAISTGSACTSETITPSHVLRAIGLKNDDINSSVRISFGNYTTEEEAVMSAKDISASVRNYIKKKEEIFA